MPNKKKKYSARFPPARIKKIMQKDDEVGKVAAAVPVIISRSLELFVESLIKKTNNLVLSRNARTLTPQHIKQTVLVENEFRFLHEVVSTIPDVQSTEDDQPPSSSSHQPPPHEAPRPVLPDPIVMATSSTVSASSSSTSVVKPGGKQRGRPRKIKTDDVKQSKPKKARLASNAEDFDSEETCSGSEDENKEFNDQSKQKSSAPQKSISSKAVPQYLPACLPATLPPILFNAPIVTGPNNHVLNNAFPLSVELPNSSKVADAYAMQNGTTQQQQQLVTSPQNLATAPSNEEVLDLSTSSGKNGDLKKDVEGMDVGHQNALLGQALPIPRTFYMTNILNANVQTVSHPNLVEGNKPLQNAEAYKLNIPKISIPTAGAALIKTDLMSPLGCRPSQPQQNFTNATRPMGSPPPQITYQIQNLAQKGHHQPQIIFSQMRPEMNQNAATDPQFFGTGSPVRLLQYPRFVSMVPGSLFGGLKMPNSTSGGIVTQAVATTTEDSKTRPDDCATKEGQS